jgi:diadenosine tetraphosphate (Ap4A) HIT family hydrolase
MALHDLLVPDGYLLGWNQGGVLHPHMHVIPRFDDEPLSDRWLRSAINLPGNRRPDPWAPGSGRAFSGCQVSEAPEPAGGAAFIPARSCDGPPRN